MKRRVLAMMFGAMMVMAASSAAFAEEASTEAEADAAVEMTTLEEGHDPVTIGWLQKNQSNAFELVINGGGEAVLEEAKEKGIVDEYYLLDGNTDPSTQVTGANDLVNLGVDAVIMQPAELDGSAAVVDICHEAGIPVVLVNSLTSNADDCEGISISNDVEAGEIMANYVLEQLGEKGGYAHCQGIIGNTAAIQRTEGVHNVMDKQEGWKMLDEQSAEWQGDKASKFAQDWIAKYGDELNAIICDNDDMAVAVRLACLEAGREDIVVIGVDFTDAAAAMIKDGELSASVRQDGTTQGAEAVRKAIALAQGREVTRETYIPFELVTSENIDQYVE